MTLRATWARALSDSRQRRFRIESARAQRSPIAVDGPEIVRSAEWPTLGALVPQAVDSATMEIDYGARGLEES
jgi:hypothetical protein